VRRTEPVAEEKGLGFRAVAWVWGLRLNVVEHPVGMKCAVKRRPSCCSRCDLAGLLGILRFRVQGLGFRV
jgi:hypothetical protein